MTNGTAVPGLGDVGAAAAKPMQEGIAMLFKRLADIDVYDLELDVKDPDRFVEAVRMLEPTFGGINIKDIKAPEGLMIYDRLRAEMGIPVFHENLYSSAGVATAALINAHIKHPKVEYFRTERAQIATVEEDKEVLVQTDGEVAGKLPMECKVVPRALRVVVP